MEEKLDGAEEVNNPRLFKGVPCLGDDLLTLGNLTEA